MWCQFCQVTLEFDAKNPAYSTVLPPRGNAFSQIDRKAVNFRAEKSLLSTKLISQHVFIDQFWEINSPTRSTTYCMLSLIISWRCCEGVDFPTLINECTVSDKTIWQVGDCCTFTSPANTPPYVGTIERIFTSRCASTRPYHVHAQTIDGPTYGYGEDRWTDICTSAPSSASSPAGTPPHAHITSTCRRKTDIDTDVGTIHGLVCGR